MYESERSQTKQTKLINHEQKYSQEKAYKHFNSTDKMIMKGYDYSYSKFYLDHLYHDEQRALKTPKNTEYYLTNNSFLQEAALSF